MAIAATAHTPGSGPGAPAELPAPSRKSRRTLLILLVPGLAWLTVFFLVPIATLAGTSTQSPAPSGDIGAFVQTFSFGNYSRVIQTYHEQFVRSFVYAGLATL